MPDWFADNAAATSQPKQDWFAANAPHYVSSNDKSVGGFVSNLMESTGQLAKDTFGALAHPVDTVKAVHDLVTGMVGHAINTVRPGAIGSEPGGDQESLKLASAVGHQLAQRYGGWDKLMDTLYKDPIGFAADLSTFADGIGAIAKVGGVGKVAEVAHAVSEATNPIRLASKGTAAALAGLPTAAAEKVSTSLAKGALRTGFRSTMDADKVEAAANALKQAGIPFSKEGLGQLSQQIADLQGEKDAALADAAQRGVSIDREAAIDPARDLLAGKGTQVNPTQDVKQVNKVIDTFRGNNPRMMSPVDAEALKEGTYAENKYGAGGPPPQIAATAQAEKAIAHGLMQELQTQIPELADLNKAQGDKLGLKPILEQAVTKYRNNGGFTGTLKSAAKSRVGIGGDILAGGAAAGAHDPIFALAGPAITLLDAVLNDPAVKTTLATAIYKAQGLRPGKWGAPNMLNAMGRVEAYHSAVTSPIPGSQPQ